MYLFTSSEKNFLKSMMSLTMFDLSPGFKTLYFVGEQRLFHVFWVQKIKRDKDG